MKAKDLYKDLDKYFIKDGMEDEWFKYMKCLDDYIYENFKLTSMGLMCDFAEEVNKVYTAVFPSERILKEIIEDNAKDAMLFLHHASDWDIRNIPHIFSQIKVGYLEEFKKRNISIYCIHVPLDNNSEYSTGVSFAEALDLEIVDNFGSYRGSMCGVIGYTKANSIEELNMRVSNIIGHQSQLYKYGDTNIKNSKVGLITGGGYEIEYLKEIIEYDINTFITGVTNEKLFIKEHEFAKKQKLNIIGGTHYSTEKFACIKMVEYFKNKGIEAIFLSDQYITEDM